MKAIQPKTLLVCLLAGLGSLTLSASGHFSHTLKGKTPWTKKAFLDDPQEFHFAIVSDRTGGERKGFFKKAMESLNLLRPSFVMSVGDLINGGGVPEPALRQQWKELNAFVESLEMPFFYVVGNHDIWTGFNGPSAGRTTSRQVWEDQFGTNTYYNFRYKGCHFVCLNSMDEHDYYPPRTPGVSARQLAWAQREILAAKQARWTFIFVHKPIDFMSDRWLAFERAIADVNYTIFCGDWHNHCTAVRNGKKLHMIGTTGGGHSGSAGDDLRYGHLDSITWVTVTKTGPVVSNLALSGIHGETIQTCATTKGWIETPLDYPPPMTDLLEAAAGETNSALVPKAVLAGPGYDWHFRQAILLRQGAVYQAGIERFRPDAERVILLGDETASAYAADWPKAQVFDMGFPGDRIENVLWRVGQRVLAGFEPHVVVVSAGRHNAPVNTPAEIAAARARLVARVRAQVPAAKIIVKDRTK